MITLHESDITSFPLDNGIGVLKDVIRAYAEEELNGMFEFYMEYDSEGHLVDELKEERIIKAKAQDKLGYQLFRIYSITKNHENDNLIVRAQHITYDLADNFVESLVANNLTKKQVMELIGSSTVLPHPFNITSPNTTTRSSTKLYRTNPLQMIGGMDGSVLQIWGGQIERNNFNLILHDRRGSDDGVKVTYEKNITGLEATFDISGLVTRIFPFVYIEETDNEPSRLITVNGKYIDSPHINDYEKIYIKPIDYSNDERINLDGTDAQIRQQLTEIASKYFEETGNDKIKVDMEVQFEHLWETEEYKHLAVLELVGMGDTVTIEHSRLKVNATAIVNYIRYDCIAEKNEEVRLGSVKARLTDSVNKVVDVAEKAEQAQQTANQAIRTANGKNTIYYGPDEPMTGQLGDLWFRVVDGEYTRTYRHDGIQWQLVLSVDVRDAMDEAQQAKDEAQQAVDRANQATQQATNAINQAQTAFDEAQAALSTASNAYDIATTLQGDVTNLSTLVDEHTGQISSITQSVTGLQTQVSDIEGNVSTLTQTVSSLTTRIGDAEGNITALQQTSSSLAARLTDAEGNITTLTATVSGLQTTVTNVQGDVSSVTQLANALQVRMTNAEGDISTLTQTASSLQSTVSSLRDDLDGLEIGGRNLIASSDITTNGGTIDKSRYATEGIIRFTANSMYDGMRITAKKLKPNSKYIFSYKYRKISGTLESFGGHNDNTWRNHVVYVDGQKSDQRYHSSSSVFVADDTNIHTVEVHVITPDEIVETDYIYIQPNRESETEVTVEIIDWQLVRGDIVPDWTPAVEDMATQSQITQLSDAINLRVMKDDVINQINISTESILIDGKRIHITGQTTIDDASIDGAKIKDASIGNAQIGTIDAAKIATGTLQSIDIFGVTIRGSTIWVDGDRPDFLYTNAIDTNPNTAGKHIYIRPTTDGEVRATVTNTIDQYVPMRADSFKAAPLQDAYITTDEMLRVTSHDKSTYRDIRGNVIYGAGFRTTTTSLWMGTDSAMHVVNKGTIEGSTNIIYRDVYANDYYARAFITRSTHAYIGSDDELRVVNKGLTGIYRNVRAAYYYGSVFEFNSALGGSHIYIRPTSSGEVQITQQGSTSDYRPVRASAFYEASSRDYKTNIEKYNESALEVINDLTVVTYNLKDDLENGILEKKIGFISEDSPAIATADGKAIQTYQLSAYNTKAIQELDMKFTNLEDRVNWLEIENQYLRQKIEHLEGMIA